MKFKVDLKNQTSWSYWSTRSWQSLLKRFGLFFSKKNFSFILKVFIFGEFREPCYFLPWNQNFILFNFWQIRNILSIRFWASEHSWLIFKNLWSMQEIHVTILWPWVTSNFSRRLRSVVSWPGNFSLRDRRTDFGRLGPSERLCEVMCMYQGLWFGGL